MAKIPISSPAPIPPAPAPASLSIRSMFKLREAQRRRPFAARAAICTGVPVLIGWLAGDTSAGMLATIGAFTAVYGSDRPYLNRAVYLAVIAVSLGVVVTIGIWVASLPWLVVPAVAAIATVAAFLCTVLRVGPPGAYIFALACAAGTAMQARHIASLPRAVGLLEFGDCRRRCIGHDGSIAVRPGRRRARAPSDYYSAKFDPQQRTTTERRCAGPAFPGG